MSCRYLVRPWLNPNKSACVHKPDPKLYTPSENPPPHSWRKPVHAKFSVGWSPALCAELKPMSTAYPLRLRSAAVNTNTTHRAQAWPFIIIDHPSTCLVLCWLAGWPFLAGVEWKEWRLLLATQSSLSEQRRHRTQLNTKKRSTDDHCIV